MSHLVLHAVFKDGTSVLANQRLRQHRKTIDHVFVYNKLVDEAPKAARKVVTSISEADLIVLGPGSLFTSILPNLMIAEIGKRY